jgi:hypothetical protein
MATWTNYDYDNIYTQADGTRIMIGVKEWAELTQTGDDLAEWQTDYAAIQAYEQPLVEAGTMAGSTMTAIIIGDNSYPSAQGKRVKVESATDSAPDFHANWIKWGERMKLDPNVTWVEGIWKLGNFVD